jgi:hypothetical protein
MQMKNALLALTEAVRRARLEIACYRDPDCRDTPEGTLDRLAKILGDHEINAAMALIDPDAESPSIVPQHDDQRQPARRH